MQPDRDTPFEAMAPLYGSVMPEHEDQVFVFAQLLDSIVYCEGLGSGAWSVTQLPNGFRLNVGQVEAMTCMFNIIHSDDPGQASRADVHIRLLLAGEDCLSKIPLPGENFFVEEMNYRSVRQQHWCYSGHFLASMAGVQNEERALVESQLQALRPNHLEFLRVACTTSTGKLRQKSNFVRHHSEALYTYAKIVVAEKAGSGNRSEPEPKGLSSIDSMFQVRLEKAAADCGFELTPQANGAALVLGSAQFPEVVNVVPGPAESFTITASSPLLLPGTHPSQTYVVKGWSALYGALETASSIARSLPNRVAQKFAKATAGMPQSTEVERMVVQRVGQQLFRDALLAFWQGRCCITGLAVPSLLRASHIRPWAKCESDEQRLDVFNGLLLAPHLDALFDSGLMTVQPDGTVVISSLLPVEALDQLGVPAPLRVHGLHALHQPYLEFHRTVVFESQKPGSA